MTNLVGATLALVCFLAYRCESSDHGAGLAGDGRGGTRTKEGGKEAVSVTSRGAPTETSPARRDRCQCARGTFSKATGGQLLTETTEGAIAAGEEGGGSAFRMAGRDDARSGRGAVWTRVERGGVRTC